MNDEYVAPSSPDDDDEGSNGGRLHHEDLLRRTMSIDDAVDKLGVGRFQHVVLFSAGMCFAADAVEITLLSFLSPVLKLEWDLSTNQTATITSCVFAGAMLGTLTLGPLGDRRGRRLVFLLSAAIITLFGFGTALTHSFAALVAMRFAVGYGVGGITAPFDLLLEVLPTEHRGKYLLWIEFFWSAGSVTVPLIAWATIGTGSSWNLFVLVCAVPCLLSALTGMCLVPESPRWLVEVGQEERALEVLRVAAKRNGKDPDQLFPADGSLRIVEHADATSTSSDAHDRVVEHQKHSGIGALLSPQLRTRTIFIWIVWFGFAFAYYGTILMISRVFQIDGEDRNQDNRADFDYSAIFVSSTAEVFGLFIVLTTVDRWGRIPTQIVFYGLGGASVFSLCYVSTTAPSWLLTIFAFFARSFEMGASCVTWISTPEMLPTELRSTGHSSANAVARVGAFVSPYIVAGDLDLTVVAWITLVIHLATMLATSRLPETSGLSLGQLKHEQKGREQRFDNGEIEGTQLNSGDHGGII